MPVGFRVSFEFADESYDNVVLVWGEGPGRSSGVAHLFGEQEHPQRVPGADDSRGSDWSIGLPVVHALLAAVERGEASATQARELLNEATGQFSCLSGCCPDCDEAVGRYDAELESHRRQLARFDDPAAYPYLVTSTTIHEWSCPHIGDMRPGHPGDSVSAWVHSHRAYDDRGGPHRLTPDEATSWLDRHTGPKGGRNWKRCRTCQPELPGAWASEANSTSSATPVT